MDIKSELGTRITEVEDILREYLPKEEGYQKNLISAMVYSTMGPGKRLRPIFMNEVYKLFGGTSDVIKPFMAAIEMIHSYSLVHDDLPAMDDDEYRRGRKTTHIVYGEAGAILAGDGLLNYAYETALNAFDIEPENKNIPKALKLLARNAGVYGMVGGQSVDVELTGKAPDSDTLDFIYKLKTGALIECSFGIGAILAGATEEDIKNVIRVAAKVGLSFQIQDDILDVIGDASVIGKPVLSDEKNDKTTYVTYKGLEKSKEDVKRLSNEAIDLLKSYPGDKEFLVELILELVNREK